MHRSNYKDQRNEYMHSNGTTASETLALILPTYFYAVITIILVSFVQTFITKNYYFIFFIEFIILVVPIVINLTVLVPYTFEILTSGLIITCSLITFINKYKKHQTELQNSPRTNFITNFRSAVNIISVVAILAVDFKIFPRKLSKTENFGFSVMDVGVGLYMLANGIVDSGTNDFKKSLKGTVPLFILGLARHVAVTVLDYPVPETEYGSHWNFFITLAVTKIGVTLIFRVVPTNYLCLSAFALTLVHEFSLQAGLEQFVFMKTDRNHYITANREGLISTGGYICLYLLSSCFAGILDIRNRSTSKIRTTLRFALLTALSLYLTVVLNNIFGVSRRLVNSGYVFWILFIGIFVLMLFYIVENVLLEVFKNKLPYCVFSPLIFEAINYNGLTFFLISNVLTGLINILCDTLKVSSVNSLLILISYMLINCLIVFVLYRNQIKLKM